MADFTARRRVEFVHTDLAGVAHFSEFVRYMESVEHEFFRSIGYSVHDEVEGRKVSWPRVSVGIDFLRPLRFEDEFDVHLGIERLGRKSVTWRAAFRHGGELCAQGRMTTACCEITADGMKAIAIPERLVELLRTISTEEDRAS